MKNLICKKCHCYNALYRKSFFKFWIENQGLCFNSNKVVREKDSCKFYQPPCEDIKIIIDLLDNAINDIKNLKKIYDVE